jgi:hypothetical protein
VRGELSALNQELEVVLHPDRKCLVPMRFVYTIPRVTEPGRLQMFQCERCEKVTSRPEES